MLALWPQATPTKLRPLIFRGTPRTKPPKISGHNLAGTGAGTVSGHRCWISGHTLAPISAVPWVHHLRRSFFPPKLVWHFGPPPDWTQRSWQRGPIRSPRGVRGYVLTTSQATCASAYMLVYMMPVFFFFVLNGSGSMLLKPLFSV